MHIIADVTREPIMMADAVDEAQQAQSDSEEGVSLPTRGSRLGALLSSKASLAEGSVRYAGL